MERNEKIKKIQELIREYGLDNDSEFWSVMKIDIDKDEKVWEYYTGIKGKCFKCVSGDETQYTKIVSLRGIKELHKITGVEVNNYTLRRGKSISYYEETGHWLCSMYPGRYKEYTEIPEAQFKEEIGKIKEYLHGLDGLF